MNGAEIEKALRALPPEARALTVHFQRRQDLLEATVLRLLARIATLERVTENRPAPAIRTSR